jgi:hypothetical protein
MELCKECNQAYPPPHRYKTTIGKYGVVIPEREIVTYTCTSEREAWHKQIKFINQKISECPSAILVNLMKQEVQSIIETRIPTLESNGNNYY